MAATPLTQQELDAVKAFGTIKANELIPNNSPMGHGETLIVGDKSYFLFVFPTPHNAPQGKVNWVADVYLSDKPDAQFFVQAVWLDIQSDYPTT